MRSDARQHEIDEGVRPQDLAWRLAPREERASALATKEAKVIDWIRGGNPWADQGWEQDQHGKYVKGPNHPDRIAYAQLQGSTAGASNIAQQRLQRSDERMSERGRARRG